ncbi:DUF167 domain-containing protein [Intestinicryptomonas porci]|uniref:UPF0235 protein MOX91_01150 n=1 Tax=Intestinicryptomonas porci TaxID=2926320 RepID=A0ABU4WGC5_9BACT|nr:DUF167 domain-containing protein [Opitutales bacterium CLA-KB-P66]
MGRIKFRIIPNARKTELAGEYANAVKIKLSAPPIEGKANAELIKYLSKSLGVSKSSITFVSGETSKDKLLEIPNFDMKAIIEKLSEK